MRHEMWPNDRCERRRRRRLEKEGRKRRRRRRRCHARHGYLAGWLARQCIWAIITLAHNSGKIEIKVSKLERRTGAEIHTGWPWWSGTKLCLLYFWSSTMFPNFSAISAPFAAAQAESGRQWNNQNRSQQICSCWPPWSPCTGKPKRIIKIDFTFLLIVIRQLRWLWLTNLHALAAAHRKEHMYLIHGLFIFGASNQSNAMSTTWLWMHQR